MVMANPPSSMTAPPLQMVAAVNPLINVALAAAAINVPPLKFNREVLVPPIPTLFAVTVPPNRLAVPVEVEPLRPN